MTFATGVGKQLRYKAESNYGVAPGASGAQSLRRVQSTLDLNKDTYQSKEIRTDYQRYDYRHGVRRIGGKISGELSPATYKDFFAAALRKTFVAGVSASAASITIAGTGPSYTVTRAAGSYLTDGFKIGDVIQLSVGVFNAANISKNLMIIALTATIATVIVLNASALVAEGPIASSTVTVMGKKSLVPQTGFTDTSFSIEHWFSDISQSELFTGCKVGSVDVNLPATGMATVDFTMMGQNATPNNAAYFTSPTGITNTALVAAVNGALIVNGTQVAYVTGLTLKLNASMTGDPVVGSNAIANVFPGTIEVSGQFTAYFQDNTMRDLFWNETESSLVVALSTNNTAAADFITFNMSRIKLGGASKDDGVKGLVLTMPFDALINAANGGAGTAYDATTLSVQDSAA